MTDTTEVAEPVVPQSVGEAAKIAAMKTLDYRDPTGEAIVAGADSLDRGSYEAGVDQGIAAFVRLVPAGDPTAFAMEQLWNFCRWMSSTQIAPANTMLADIHALMKRYETSLPEPDSIIAKAGRWRVGRRDA